MPEAEPTYNLKAVTQQTGIPAASLRAWEKRYGLPAPVRKPNGHRVYPASEVARLLRVKGLMARGMTISQAVEQVRHAAPGPDLAQTGELDRLRTELAGALADLDTRMANQLFARALDMLPAEQVCVQVVRPMLAELQPFGRTYFRSRLGALLVHAPHYPAAPLALVLNPDPLDLRPLLVAVFLSRRGRQVIYVEGEEAPAGLQPDMVVNPRLWEGAASPEELFG